MILIAFYVPLALIFVFFSETLLMKIGQDPTVSSEANVYILLTMPGMFFAGQSDLTRRWLQAMRFTLMPMIV